MRFPADAEQPSHGRGHLRQVRPAGPRLMPAITHVRGRSLRTSLVAVRSICGIGRHRLVFADTADFRSVLLVEWAMHGIIRSEVSDNAVTFRTRKKVGMFGNEVTNIAFERALSRMSIKEPAGHARRVLRCCKRL
jgi:hypothetical protein